MPKTKTPIDPETGEVLDKVETTIGANNQIVPRTTPVPGKTIPEIAAAPAALPMTGFAKLAKAIADITQEVAENPIKKEGRNAFHNYSYARMQDILGGLTPLMSKHGVVVMQTEIERGFMDNGNAIFATYDFTIIHKSGEVWPFPQRQTGVSNTRTSKGTFDDKGLNKCHTSARKYFLLSLFQIPTTDDDDADRGDNDAGYRAARNTGAKSGAKTETGSQPQSENPAPPAEPEKMKPHPIDRPPGISAAVWGGKFIEQILLCDEVPEIDLWLEANDQSLDELEKKAPKVYANVKKAIDNRIGWIETPEARS